MIKRIRNRAYVVTLSLLISLAGVFAVGLPVSANIGKSDGKEQIIKTYRAFAAAQNARDLDQVGQFFVDGPQFLWVSDGRSVWGRDATLKRMGGFQRAEQWEVFPGLENAEVIMLSDDSGLLHMPLTLEIGRAENPNKLRFLVSIVFQKIEDEWKIASLLTTNDKTRR